MGRVNVLRGAVQAELLSYGNGNGDGDGYGDGYGNGNGNGYGHGYGNGNGNGYGHGYGNGNGNGYGYGYGHGDGYGYGNGNYWLAAIPNLMPSEAHECAKQSGATIAFWKSGKHGEPCNGGDAGVKAEVGAMHEVPGPLSLCHRGTLHATSNPPQWQGDRLWIVALHGEVVSDGEKFGALKREILAEVIIGK